MRRRTAGLIIGVGLLALPAVSLGQPVGSNVGERAGLGAVVAQDSAKANPAATAARATINGSDIGKVSYRITASPSNTKVDWGITTRCVKGSLIEYFPGPGDFKTDTKPAGFGGTFPVGFADPDFCTFAVAAQTYKVEAGKKVAVKIYNTG